MIINNNNIDKYKKLINKYFGKINYNNINKLDILNKINQYRTSDYKTINEIEYTYIFLNTITREYNEFEDSINISYDILHKYHKMINLINKNSIKDNIFEEYEVIVKEVINNIDTYLLTIDNIDKIDDFYIILMNKLRRYYNNIDTFSNLLKTIEEVNKKQKKISKTSIKTNDDFIIGKSYKLCLDFYKELILINKALYY
ncbi:MAG: hypothetical protein IJZ36_03325, partial [Bacilli bacterium]|nr:hypothetical protein [Bacilli bacterium]